jgi:hypothetical protein
MNEHNLRSLNSTSVYSKNEITFQDVQLQEYFTGYTCLKWTPILYIQIHEHGTWLRIVYTLFNDDVRNSYSTSPNEWMAANNQFERILKEVVMK